LDFSVAKSSPLRDVQSVFYCFIIQDS
jgi:hypothetical protein